MWSLQVYHKFIEIRRTYAIRPRTCHRCHLIPPWFLLRNTSRSYIGQRSPPHRGAAAWSRWCGALIVFSLPSDPLTQMQAQSSSELLLSRKRKRDGSNGEMEEGERSGKIPRCTVVSQLSPSLYVSQPLRLWIHTRTYMWKQMSPVSPPQ